MNTAEEWLQRYRWWRRRRRQRKTDWQAEAHRIAKERDALRDKVRYLEVSLEQERRARGVLRMEARAAGTPIKPVGWQ